MATKKQATPKKAAPKKAASKKPAAKKAEPQKAPAKKAAVSDKPMTKAQIVTYFAEKFSMTKDNAASIIDELVELSAKEAKRIGSFTIPGLGKLSLTNRKARMGRNPSTGEAIKIPAKTVVKMKLSKTFTDTVVPAKKKTAKK